MIRHRQADDWLLFTQHDHALLSGWLAERIGGLVQKPAALAIQGIALHDCGWPLHDDRPTLNAAGEPLHVFEAPPALSTRIWSASAQRASNKDPYVGLLVSVHVLYLSGLSSTAHHTPQEVFAINKFQHQQIELQELLRRRLGMRIDVPLSYGLAELGQSPEEDELLFNYRLLRALDQLSLALLCSETLFDAIDVCPRPGEKPAQIRIARTEPFAARLDPWPFDSSTLEFTVPYQRLPVRHFATPEEFQASYAVAAAQSVSVRVSQ